MRRTSFPLRTTVKYDVITDDVSDYINLLVRIAHIICNRPLYKTIILSVFCMGVKLGLLD
jgi:hypothetical protein